MNDLSMYICPDDKFVEKYDLSAGRSTFQSLRRSFEEAASVHSAKTAIFDGKRKISFSDLNEKANYFANILISQGVSTGKRVAILLDKSIDSYISMLAIVKIGATYIPCDPELPEMRLESILKQSRPFVVIKKSSSEVSELLFSYKTIDIDEVLSSLHENVSNLDVDYSSKESLYMIFTSGSTGLPKGVVISYENAETILMAMDKIQGLGRKDRWLSLASLSFDISFVESFYPLVFGGSIVIGEKDWIFDSKVLSKNIDNFNVDIIQQTPSAWRLMLSANLNVKKRIKAICCGEALSEDLACKLRKYSTHLWNFYGPTEAAVYASYFSVGDEVLLKNSEFGTVPIGKALDGYALYVLDEYLNEVPSGLKGTLYIGGPAVAQCYWSNPEKTALSFIPDSFSRHIGARLYNTNDIVVKDDSGCITYLYRNDDQVKIRGNRVELGEVEAIINEIDGVSTSVVKVSQDDKGGNFLVAFVEQSGIGAVSTDSVAHYIRSRLPSYMHPAVINVLNRLPLTPSGKVDSKALLASEFTIKQDAVVAPTSELEEKLHYVWKDTLGHTEFGVTDSFFSMGGHSLMAVALIKEIERETGYTISFSALMKNQTIRDLANYISENKHTCILNANEPLVHDTALRYQAFPMAEIQQAYWLGVTGGFSTGSCGAYNYLEVDIPPVCVGELKSAVEKLIERHDMLRVNFLDDGSQTVSKSKSELDIPFYDLSKSDEAYTDLTLSQIREEMTFKSKQFSPNVIFDLRLSQRSPTKFTLHSMINIMVFDASSMHIFFTELAELLENPEKQFDNIAIQFRDYVISQSDKTNHESYKKAKSYWCSRVEEFPSAPVLPLAKNINDVADQFFVRRKEVIECTDWNRIKFLASEKLITPSVLLATLFSRALSLWSETSHFALNLTLYNRPDNHPHLKNVIGGFTTVNLLEVDTSLSNSILGLAQQVQSRLWQDIENIEYSGMEFLREINLTRRSKEKILMPIVFNSELGFDEGHSKSELATRMCNREKGISQTPQVWLDFGVFEAEGKLVLTLDALEELFHPGVLDGILSLIHQELLSLSVDGSAKWERKERPSLPKDQQEVRKKVNSRKMPLPRDLLHIGIQKFATQSPNSIAIYTSDLQITYDQLNQVSNKAAKWLTEKNVRVNELVAIVMKKGWEQVAAALAILKSGAAYLPINSEFPDARIQLLLEQGDVKKILVQEGEYLSSQVMQKREVYTLTNLQPSEQRYEDSSPKQTLNDLAYVIFTSGSTGVPKGVAIDHRGAGNTIDSIKERYSLTSTDRVLALSSLSFDLSVFDIFGMLSVGGSIVMPDHNKSKDPEHWHELVQTRSVSIWNSVPALMQIYVEYLRELDAKAAPSIRQVMLSGDWIPLNLPVEISKCFPDTQIDSLGGATEASIWSICYPIQSVEDSWKSIPYGKPLANQTYHVLDNNLADCPDWVPGDLYIGGVGLAQCYWGDDEKTRAHFFTHPSTGERLYRTGDIGRYFPDGNIEFLGRKDTQVKVQGYRIELGEVESVINSTLSVKQSAVKAFNKNGPSGDSYLVAYIAWDKSDGYSDEDAEKLEFKLQRHGLRHDLTGAVCPEGLGKNAAETLALRLNTPYIRNDKKVELKSLYQILSCLTEIEVTGHPYNKYYYASAGGLNPIQAYLDVPFDAYAALPGGRYYFDPVNGRLQKVSNCEIASELTLRLLACRGAIEPMYGDASKRLVELEAGYMFELINSTALANGAAFHKIMVEDNCNISIGSDKPVWMLGTYGLHRAKLLEETKTRGLDAPRGIERINTLELKKFDRQSFRKFSNRQISKAELEQLLASCTELTGNSIKIYLGLKSDAVEDFSAGVYQYCTDTGEIECVTRNDVLNQSNFDRVNRPVFEDSKLALYFVGRDEVKSTITSVGMLAQRCLSVGTVLEIGFCPIGYFDDAELCHSMGLQADECIIHSLLGGPIELEQTEVWGAGGYFIGDYSVDKLRQSLDALLPSYMLPSAFIELDSFPLTANGKLDRNALEEPRQGTIKAKILAPKNEIQRKLLSIWTETLERDDIGIKEHFFELGGSSIQLVGMRQKIMKELDCRLEVIDLFKFSTIESLSSYIKEQSKTKVLEHNQASSTDTIKMKVSRSRAATKMMHKKRNLKNGRV